LSLDIAEGEIFALLGPNGAGKTTLIGTVCGLVQPTGGQVRVGGHDTATDYRAARSLIGLVPQEVNLEPFEKVINTVRFSRGLFGKPRDEALIERVLRQLSLWDKRDSQIRALSGGMKRRVLIAKALAHEPRVLFLDEPTAGVDVELRRDMWDVVRGAAGRRRHDHPDDPLPRGGRGDGRPGRRDHQGAPLLVEEKAALMTRLGRKELVIELREPLEAVPEALAQHG
jgi:ABC-2 type transport system ATP-binding protein